jgi:hypothetical protein
LSINKDNGKKTGTKLHMLDTEKLITIQPAKIMRILGFIVVLLVLANVAVQLIKFVEWHTFLSRRFQSLSFEQMMKIVAWIPSIRSLVYIFDLGAEYNVPTYFSTVIILMAAFLLNTIAAFKKRFGHSYALRWRILAIIFLYLSLDEAITIHEWATIPTQKILGPVWGIPDAWVIPVGILVLIFALSYCRFLLHLPLKSRILFSIAGVLYVGGAIGMERLGGYYANIHGYTNFTFNMIATIEEIFEMVGIILFIYALLDYIRVNIKDMRIRIGGYC